MTSKNDSTRAIVPYCKATETALLMPETLDEKRWGEIGEWLSSAGRSIQWWIGDWWAFGEHRYGDRKAWADAHKLDDAMCRKAAVVSVAFKETFRRRNVLTFSHHAEVASLKPDEQDAWLDWAVQERATRQQLRTALSKEKFLLTQARTSGDGSAIAYRQDAIDFLTSLAPASVDLLLTDPPYMTDVDDVVEFASSWFRLALSRIKPTGRAYVFVGAYPFELNTYLSFMVGGHDLRVGNVLVWTYRNTLGPSPSHDYKLNWQACLYLYGKEAPPLDAPIMLEQFTVQDINAPDGRVGDRLHTWQKPDELAERLIRHGSDVGATIIDPFCGTGTFMAAARRLGRTAIGCDIDAAMLELCKARGIEVAG